MESRESMSRSLRWMRRQRVSRSLLTGQGLIMRALGPIWLGRALSSIVLIRLSSSKDVHNVGKDIKAAELICRKVGYDLEKYLSNCIYYGIQADHGDEFVSMTQPIRDSIIAEVDELMA